MVIIALTAAGFLGCYYYYCIVVGREFSCGFVSWLLSTVSTTALGSSKKCGDWNKGKFTITTGKRTSTST